jgi:REP element-mobilizing transposase RayT
MVRGKPVSFRAFDRDAEIDSSSRHLPHWFQVGVATFVTFRTFDSMPRDVVQRWHDEIAEWLRDNGHDGGVDPGQLPTPGSLPERLQAEYRRVRSRGWQGRLDQCHGQCVLRRPELARIVADTLLHFDGNRYDLDSFVVMPNHVHLIVQFRTGFHLRQQTESWLRFSATKINRRLGRKGAFWQAEPFDHLVRSERQFEYLQSYIQENPKKANLSKGEFIYWTR